MRVKFVWALLLFFLYGAIAMGASKSFEVTNGLAGLRHVAVSNFIGNNVYVKSPKKILVEPIENQIRLIMLNQEKAWNHGNLDSFMLYYWNSPKLRFVSKNKVSFGWQQVYDNYQKSYAAKGEMGKLSFDIKSVDLIGKQDALVVGSWKVENNKGIFEGHFTLWFQQIEGNWLIVMDHTS